MNIRLSTGTVPNATCSPVLRTSRPSLENIGSCRGIPVVLHSHRPDMVVVLGLIG